MYLDAPVYIHGASRYIWRVLRGGGNPTVATKPGVVTGRLRGGAGLPQACPVYPPVRYAVYPWVATVIQGSTDSFEVASNGNRPTWNALDDLNRPTWDALDENTRKKIAGLSAYHSLAHSQKEIGEETKSGNSEYTGYGLDVENTPLRPLVKTHPETSRQSLAVGRHAFGIPGLAPQESASLLEELIQFAVNDERRTYQHRWHKGDVVVWDNRCLLHKACAWDYSEPRVMLHSRIAGNPASESAASS